MIRGELNDDSLFFSVLKNFQEEFRDSTATGKDFLHTLNETSGREFDWFFDQWYYGSGYPEFNFNWWVREDSLFLHCEQSGSSERTPLFRINMELHIEYADGSDALVILPLKEADEQFGMRISGVVAGLHADPNNWIPDKTQLIRKYISEGEFYISPNPFEEQLNVTFSTDARREINLADMNGRIVQKWNFHSAEVILNTNRLNQGLYLLQVKEGNDSYTAKVMKK
jgi:hypothetical protein